MLVLIIYALAVLAVCFFSIRLLRLKFSALLAVALWTVLGPTLMQLLNFLLVGYVDPFWKWAFLVQAGIALVASIAALVLCAVIDQGGETT